MKRAPMTPEDLLRTLGNAPVPGEEPCRAAARRDQVVAHLASVISHPGQRRNARRFWVPVAAALALAASIALVAGATGVLRSHPPSQPVAALASPAARARAMEGTVLFARDGHIEPLSTTNEVPLFDGDELRTSAQGRATMLLSTGVIVDVAPASSLSLDTAHATASADRERLVLTLGRVDLTVPKLTGGRTFGIRTPDAEVVVHGTRFSVVVTSGVAGKPSITAVQVTEGRVSVNHAGAEIVLSRGETWSSEDIPAPPESPSAVVAEPSGSVPAVVAGNAAKFPSAPSSLAQENKLFQNAMDAKRRGDDRRVVSVLDSLLSRYAGSPLANNARVERFRALKRLGDNAAAAREARKYLAEDPDGFARDEARDTVLAPASSARP